MVRAGRMRTGAVLLLLTLLPATVATAALQVVWGPILGDVTPTSFQLAWYSNVPAQGTVQIGDQTVAPGEARQAHRVQVHGLEPDTVYQYRVVMTAGDERLEGRWYRLHTPALDLAEFTFCAYGDTRSNPRAHRQVVQAMVQSRPRLILHSGDLVNDGTLMSDWHQFFGVIAQFSPTIPLYPALGNHERNSELYYRFLPLPLGEGDHNGQWYQAVYGSCQFLILDSCRRFAEQADWLREVLAQPRPSGVHWRIAVFHHPPYTSGPHAPDQSVLRHFCPLLEQGEVDLVFNGHNHLYERSLKGRLNYVIVGAGGAPIYRNANLPNPYRRALATVLSFVRVEVSPEALQVTALDTEQKVLDQFTVTR